MFRDENLLDGAGGFELGGGAVALAGDADGAGGEEDEEGELDEDVGERAGLHLEDAEVEVQAEVGAGVEKGEETPGGAVKVRRADDGESCKQKAGYEISRASGAEEQDEVETKYEAGREPCKEEDPIGEVSRGPGQFNGVDEDEEDLDEEHSAGAAEAESFADELEEGDGDEGGECVFDEDDREVVRLTQLQNCSTERNAWARA